jgi:hypothetical protein
MRTLAIVVSSTKGTTSLEDIACFLKIDTTRFDSLAIALSYFPSIDHKVLIELGLAFGTTTRDLVEVVVAPWCAILHNKTLTNVVASNLITFAFGSSIHPFNSPLALPPL